MKFKLNRIAKAGLALGLSALITLSATGCGINYTTYNDNNNPSTSQTQPYQSDYINTTTSNEFKVYDEDLTSKSISLKSADYVELLDKIATGDYTFKYAPYYGLEEALAMYNQVKYDKSKRSTLLNGEGKLDEKKLQEKILENNKTYMSNGKDAINAFYTEISPSDLTMICKTIAEVVNKEYNDVQIEHVANTLMNMTCFQRTGSASNAYITNNLTFVYNPSMSGLYANMQEIQGNASSKKETLEQVINHEVMHLLQYSASDSQDENGLESGICRMYNIPNKDTKVPVDSLWYSWLLEASAELGMSDYLNIKPGTYAKKISYAKSYNLSRFNDLNLEKNSLEDITFNHTLEEAYQELGLHSNDEQRELLNYLYSVEITQSDPEDFWSQYTKLTNETPTEEEKLNIRMQIRAEAIKYLSRNFYENLADALYTGTITDLDTAFYLIRTWELDIFGHLEYTKTTSLESAKDFIIWHNEIQNSLFEAIANSNNVTLEEIKAEYKEYNLQANVDNKIYENCNLQNYSDYTKKYITQAKETYTTNKFSRNAQVYDYIQNNTPVSTNNYKK